MNEKEAKLVQAANMAYHSRAFLDEILDKKTSANIKLIGHEMRSENPSQLKINLIAANLVVIDDIKQDLNNTIRKAAKIEKEILDGTKN